jgi:hypothetical protein
MMQGIFGVTISTTSLSNDLPRYFHLFWMDWRSYRGRPPFCLVPIPLRRPHSWQDEASFLVFVLRGGMKPVLLKRGEDA